MMDERLPLWRTAWYWKQVCLYLVGPLILMLGALTALNKTNHLAQHKMMILSKLITLPYPFAFTVWINRRARKRAIA